MRIKNVLQLKFFKSIKRVYITHKVFYIKNIIFQIDLGLILGLQWPLLLWLQIKSWQTTFNLLFSFYFLICFLFRSSRSEVFCKKSVLRYFSKFTGKHQCQSLFLNKKHPRVAAYQKDKKKVQNDFRIFPKSLANE